MFAVILRSELARIVLAVTFTFTTTWAWCYVDKVYAVRAAKDGLATKVEVQALKAEAEEARRLAALAEVAFRNLTAEVDRAEANEQIAKEELENYVKENEINSTCLVDNNLVKRLRNR